jgi:hypothetical protein
MPVFRAWIERRGKLVLCGSRGFALRDAMKKWIESPDKEAAHERPIHSLLHRHHRHRAAGTEPAQPMEEVMNVLGVFVSIYSGVWWVLGLGTAYLGAIFFFWCMCAAAGNADRLAGRK